MTLKKIITSSGEGIIIINEAENPNKFPVGFSYMLGNILYKVAGIVTKDANAEMRKMVGSDGSDSIVSLETIEKDLKSYDCHVLTTGVEVPETVQDVVKINNEQPQDEQAPVEQIKRKRGRPKKQK